MPTPQISPVLQLINALRSFMDLRENQVVLYNQKWKNPNDDGLYIFFALIGTKPYGNTREYQNSDDNEALLEILTVHTQETYSIHVYSRSQAAWDRKEEVLLFLNSTAVQQIQEAVGFKLATIPVSFVDTSETEGAGRINKYTITVNLLRMVQKENVVQYYDKFPDSNKKLLINP